MNPLFFGSSEHPLFGIHHPPTARPRVRDHAVLLCGPAPQEYMRTHWAFRKLSAMLAREGFHVFRFDYLGTGDSAGRSDEATVSAFRQSLVTAAKELKDIAMVSKISAVGFRLGAAVAATAPGLTLSQLVMWEPVIKGSVFMMELKKIQRRYLSQFVVPPWDADSPRPELLGFPVTRTMEAELREVDLLRAPPPKASKVWIVVSEDKPLFREYRKSLEAQGASAAYLHIPDETQTEGAKASQGALLSHGVLTTIVGKLAG